MTPAYTLVGCQGCAVPVRVYGGRNRNFCSTSCRSTHVRAGQACAQCGGAISRPRSHGRKFCSRACWSAAQRLEFGRGLRNEAVASYLRHARERGLAWNLDDAEVDELFAGACHWCGAPPSNHRVRDRSHGDFTYNGIDRVDNELPYERSNCVSCCRLCNLMKRDLPAAQFIEHARAIVGRWS